MFSVYQDPYMRPWTLSTPGLLNLLAIAGPVLLAVSSPDRLWVRLGRGFCLGCGSVGLRMCGFGFKRMWVTKFVFLFRGLA